LRHRRALAADHEPARIEPHLEAIAEADEGEASEPLTALDALEQEARAERGQLHERRYRRVQITRNVERRLQRSSSP